MPDPTTVITSYRLPTATNVATGPNGGLLTWSGRTNLFARDDTFLARVDVGAGGESQYLFALNYGFSVPSTAVIEGIEVRIRARGASALIGAVNLRDAAGGIGTSLGGTFVLNSSLQDFVFGGPTTNPNAFGSAHVSGSEFGVRFYAGGFAADAYIEVDSVEVRIYYHLPGTYSLSGQIKNKLWLTNRVPAPAFEATAFPTIAMSEVVSAGGVWDTPEGALTPDGVYAESRRISAAGSGTTNDTPSDILNTKMLGWSIPSIATIKSIRLRIFRGLNATDSTAKLIDHQIKLLRDGAAWGPNKAAFQVPATANTAIYTWSGSDLTGLSRADLLAGNFGATQQYYSTTDSPSNGKVRVHWTELRVQWDILAGTITQTPAVSQSVLRVTRPVTASAAAVSTAVSVMRVAIPLSGTTTALSTSIRASIGKIKPLGTATGAATSAATAHLGIGVPQPLTATVANPLVLAPATPSVNYALSALIRNPVLLRPSSLVITSIASVSGFSRRFRELLPEAWWGDTHPLLDAIMAALVTTTIHGFQMIRFADLQTRIRTATGGFLDLISGDFFGSTLPRREHETDDRFRERIRREIFRERVTRHGLSRAIEDLVGTAPVIVEPQRPADTGAYGTPYLAYGTAGCWASRDLDYQAFVTVTLPSAVGIPFVGGYSTPVFAYGSSGLAVWNDSQPVEDALTAEDVYEVLERNKPVGTVLWVNVR